MKYAILELAKEREAAWIRKHQRHDYGGRDCRGEALEELADAINYLRQSEDDFEEIIIGYSLLSLGDELARRMKAP